MDTELIQLVEVTKKFGKNTVLNEINLTIPENKITGIIGASGEGKSTILKLIASFYKPTEGNILYRKRNIKKDISNIKKIFGISIEEGSFYENLTVKENLFHFGSLYKVDKKTLKRRIPGIMKFVGLYTAKDILAKNLSLGMKKRLDLACAIIHKPKVLILDEPTADLDPILRQQMMKLIKKINSNGTTVVFTTQLLEEADEICDYISILYNEKIIEQGKINSIKDKYKTNNLNKLFKKIFSKKGRKIYLEKHKKIILENQKKENMSEDILSEIEKDIEISKEKEGKR